MNLSEQVANRETECEALRAKSDADDKMIDLLKEQNAEQAKRLAQMQKEYDRRIEILVQERDEANARAQEVRGVIESLGHLALQGLDRMAKRGTYGPPPIDLPKPRSPAQATIEKYHDHLDPDPVHLLLSSSKGAERRAS